MVFTKRNSDGAVASKKAAVASSSLDAVSDDVVVVENCISAELEVALPTKQAPLETPVAVAMERNESERNAVNILRVFGLACCGVGAVGLGVAPLCINGGESQDLSICIRYRVSEGVLE